MKSSKIISYVLSLSLLSGFFSVPVYAEENPAIQENAADVIAEREIVESFNTDKNYIYAGQSLTLTIKTKPEFNFSSGRVSVSYLDFNQDGAFTRLNLEKISDNVFQVQIPNDTEYYSGSIKLDDVLFNTDDNQTFQQTLHANIGYFKGGSDEDVLFEDPSGMTLNIPSSLARRVDLKVETSDGEAEKACIHELYNKKYDGKIYSIRGLKTFDFHFIEKLGTDVLKPGDIIDYNGQIALGLTMPDTGDVDIVYVDENNVATSIPIISREVNTVSATIFRDGKYVLVEREPKESLIKDYRLEKNILLPGDSVKFTVETTEDFDVLEATALFYETSMQGTVGQSIQLTKISKNTFEGTISTDEWYGSGSLMLGNIGFTLETNEKIIKNYDEKLGLFIGGKDKMITLEDPSGMKFIYPKTWGVYEFVVSTGDGKEDLENINKLYAVDELKSFDFHLISKEDQGDQQAGNLFEYNDQFVSYISLPVPEGWNMNLVDVVFVDENKQVTPVPFEVKDGKAIVQITKAGKFVFVQKQTETKPEEPKPDEGNKPSEEDGKNPSQGENKPNVEEDNKKPSSEQKPSTQKKPNKGTNTSTQTNTKVYGSIAILTAACAGIFMYLNKKNRH